MGGRSILRMRQAGAVLALAVLAAAVAALPLASAQEPPQAPDSALRIDGEPLRRIVLSPARAALEIDKLGRGILVKMPLSDLNDLVRQAVANNAALQATQPRLIAATYSARLKGASLLGSAHWEVLNTGKAPALLSVQPFNLALLRQPYFSNRPALIADFDERVPSLLLDSLGEHSLMLEWSARGDERPGGLRFDLRFPPAVAAQLELDLPIDHLLSLEESARPVVTATKPEPALLSGPFAADVPGLRRWRITCPGRSQIAFRIRSLAKADRLTAVVLCRQETTQVIHAGSVEARYKFHLEAPRRGVRELLLECDPTLLPWDVTVQGSQAVLRDWEVHRERGGSTYLTVRLSEPVQEATVLIDALAPLRTLSPAGESVAVAWTSPNLRALGVVPGGEELELKIDPDLRLENWQPGDFRLTRADEEADPARKTFFQRLTLVGGGLLADAGGPTEADAQSRRPSATLLSSGTAYRARQLAWWQVRASGELLTVQVAYEMTRGSLESLPLLLPGDWYAESVQVSPNKLLKSFRVDRDRGRPILIVELREPLRATGRLAAVPGREASSLPSANDALFQRTATLTVKLRPRQPRKFLNFPDTDPLGQYREGALAIDVDEQAFQAVPRTPLAFGERNAREEGPWGQETPLFYYPFTGQPISGILARKPRPGAVRAHATTDVFFSGGRPMVESRLQLTAEAGSTDHIDVVFSDAGADAWEWHGARGGPPVQAQRVADPAAIVARLAACGPLDAAGLALLRPYTACWRLTWSRPLQVPESYQMSATRPLTASSGRYQVPLPMITQASRFDGEVSLHLTGANVAQIETAGLREIAPEAHARNTPVWRTFRYSTAPVGLEIRGLPAGASVSGTASSVLIDQARLTTYLGPGDVLQHHFAFQIANWPRNTLPVVLPPGARPVAAQADGEILPALVLTANNTLELPVPDRTGVGDGWRRFEVVYVTDAAEWSVWVRASSRAPKLPQEPIRFRRTWRLPPGVVPLFESSLCRLPGPGEIEAPPRHEPRPADLFRLGPSASDLVMRGKWPNSSLDPQLRQTLADAGLGVRSGRAGQTLPLGEVLELVADDCLKRARLPLVVDTVALREARLAPQTPLTVAPLISGDEPEQPWEPLGLVTVFTRSVPVLTTHRQAELWDALGATAAPLPDELEQAIALAVRQGYDPSGRFVVAPAWLRHEAEVAATTPAAETLDDDNSNGPWSLLSPGLTLGHWTEWEPIGGISAPGEMIVVRREMVTTVAFGLTAVALLICWRLGRRKRRRRLWFLVLWLTLSGAALYLLPNSLHALAWWPFLAACAVTLAWYVIALVRATPRHADGTGVSAHSGKAAAAVTSATLVLFALSAWHFSARSLASREKDRASPPTVLLVAGSTPEQSIALLTPALRDRLLALAHPPSGPAVVLLSAVYDGKIVDGEAELNATYQAYCRSDGPATLILPLDGVRLVGKAWLDGKPINDLVLAANETGFAVRVAARGPHKIELSFRVTTDTARIAGERSMRFTVPRLGQCRLSFQAPPGASYPLALYRFGNEEVVAKKDGPLLLTELGRVGTVQVLWHEGGRTVPEREVRFREAYLWNLRADGSALTAVIQYDIPDGMVRELTIDLPPELEVRDADAAPVGPADLGTARAKQTVRLRDWRVTEIGGRRALRLEFQNPVGGACEVRLGLVPRYPMGAGSAPLPLPAPRGTPSSAPSAAYGHLAYRTTGVEAILKATFRVTKRIDAADFAKSWPADLRDELGIPDYACTFLREHNQGPLLQLQLRPRPPAVHAVQELSLNIAPHQTSIHATANLSVKPRAGVLSKELVLVEWDIQFPPPRLAVLSVTSLAGPAVRRWSQTGSRVQIWLDRATDAVKLELNARLTAPPGKETTLDLPNLRLVSAQTQSSTLRLSANSALTLTPLANTLRNLTPAPRFDSSEQVYVAAQPYYAGTWTVRRATCQADAQVLTVLSARERRLSFKTIASIQVRRGELRIVRLRLCDWDGGAVEVSAKGTMRSTTAGERVWTFELPPGVTGSYRLTMSGSVPLADTGAGVWAPDVSVIVGTPVPTDGPRRKEKMERWLAVTGTEFVTEGPPPTISADASKAFAQWPEEAARLRGTNISLWKLPVDTLAHDLEERSSAWKLRLSPRDRERPAESVQLFLEEQSAAVADGRHWLHETTYWLRHEDNAELNVVLPAPGRVVAASVDGVAVTPLQPEPARLWLPLPRRAGVRWVRLRWLYDEEPLLTPNLSRPKIVGTRDSLTLWTLHSPDGFQTKHEQGANLRSGLARAAALDLYRAAAQQEIIHYLTGELDRDTGDRVVRGELAAAQGRFYQYCRQAEHALAEVPAGGIGEKDPEGHTLTDWLARLLESNREQTRKPAELEAIRSAAERQAEQIRAIRPLPDAAVPNAVGYRAGGRSAAVGYARTGAGGTALPERGTAFAGSGGPDAASPVVRLTPITARERGAALLGVSWWLGLIAGIWVLTLVPSVLHRTRPFWPEQLVLLGAVGWYVAGPRPVVLALLIAWAVVRLVRIGRLAMRSWHAGMDLVQKHRFSGANSSHV